jgi:hypothetical protein
MVADNQKLMYNGNKYYIDKLDIMRKSTRSILQELNDLGISRNKDLVIESRGSNLIDSAINLLTLIKENYDIETAAELERRFLNAIRSSDAAKFKRGMQKIHESRK